MKKLLGALIAASAASFSVLPNAWSVELAPPAGWPDDLNTTARTSSLFTTVPEVIASYVTVPEDCDKTVNGRSCKDMMDMACDCLPAAWRAACGTCCRPPGNGPGQACDPINNNQYRMCTFNILYDSLGDPCSSCACKECSLCLQ